MSRFNPKQLQGDQFIHETEFFGVEIGKLRSKGDWQGLKGYLLVNKDTQVIEGEFTVEFAAVRTMRELQTELEAALENKQSTEQGAEPELNQDDFEALVRRLAEEQTE